MRALFFATAAMLTTSSVHAATVTKRDFGKMPDGTEIEAPTLPNDHGMKATVITLGAAVQSVIVPDRDGKLADVAPGYLSLRFSTEAKR